MDQSEIKKSETDTQNEQSGPENVEAGAVSEQSSGEEISSPQEAGGGEIKPKIRTYKTRKRNIKRHRRKKFLRLFAWNTIVALGIDAVLAIIFHGRENPWLDNGFLVAILFLVVICAPPVSLLLGYLYATERRHSPSLATYQFLEEKWSQAAQRIYSAASFVLWVVSFAALYMILEWWLGDRTPMKIPEEEMTLFVSQLGQTLKYHFL
jgi:hypothetical protein